MEAFNLKQFWLISKPVIPSDRLVLPGVVCDTSGSDPLSSVVTFYHPESLQYSRSLYFVHNDYPI